MNRSALPLVRGVSGLVRLWVIPRRVVDGDVHVLPAGMPGVLLPIAGHPMPRTLETPEFLDVQVQQIPRMFVLVAIDGLRWLKCRKPIQSQLR